MRIIPLNGIPLLNELLCHLHRVIVLVVPHEVKLNFGANTFVGDGEEFRVIGEPVTIHIQLSTCAFHTHDILHGLWWYPLDFLCCVCSCGGINDFLHLVGNIRAL